MCTYASTIERAAKFKLFAIASSSNSSSSEFAFRAILACLSILQMCDTQESCKDTHPVRSQCLKSYCSYKGTSRVHYSAELTAGLVFCRIL